MSDTVLGPGSFFLSRKTCAFLAYPVSGSPAPLPPPAGGEEGCLTGRALAEHPSLQFSLSVVSNFLRPHGLQHARLPCPLPTSGACSNSRPSSRWCHPAISSSVVPVSSRLLGSGFAALVITLKATRGQRRLILSWITAQPEQLPSLKRGPFSSSQCVEDHFANWSTQQITSAYLKLWYSSECFPQLLFHLKRTEFFLISVHRLLNFGDMRSHQACDPAMTWPPLPAVTQLGR